MKSLKTRLAKYVDDVGIRINKIAEDSGVDLDRLYRLRAGAQKGLTEQDAIRLHDYLKEKNY